MLLLRSIYFFFFFKQKTSYDVRISDWSSDVSSSDLPLPMMERTVLFYDFHRQYRMPRSQNVLRLGQNRSLGPTGPNPSSFRPSNLRQACSSFTIFATEPIRGIGQDDYLPTTDPGVG